MPDVVPLGSRAMAEVAPQAMTVEYPGDGFVLRPARAPDNDALLSLARACPMQANVSVAIERAPDFFALLTARGESRAYVATTGGCVVACASVSRRPAYLAGAPGEMGYVADIKVHPGWRGRGIAGRLLAAIAADERASAPVPYVGSVAAGNVALAAAIRRLTGVQARRVLGQLTSYQLLPHLPLGIPAGVVIERAGSADEGELAELLDDFHRPRQLAPVFADGGLRRLIARSPGMSLGDYRIARCHGRIVAAAATWDAAAVKQTRIGALPISLRWLGRAVQAAGRLVPLPALPRQGDYLRALYIRHAGHAPGHVAALAAVVRSIVRDVGVTGRHCALFTCAAGDPVRQCLRGIPRTAYHYALIAGALEPTWAARLPELSQAWAYDDAAIA